MSYHKKVEESATEQVWMVFPININSISSVYHHQSCLQPFPAVILSRYSSSRHGDLLDRDSHPNGRLRLLKAD